MMQQGLNVEVPDSVAAVLNLLDGVEDTVCTDHYRHAHPRPHSSPSALVTTITLHHLPLPSTLALTLPPSLSARSRSLLSGTKNSTPL